MTARPPPAGGPRRPTLGVVVVTFDSSDVVLDCLESLLAARDVALDVVVVDNASTDGTAGLVRDWAAGRRAYEAPPDLPFALAPGPKPVVLGERTGAGHVLDLVAMPENRGFAAGVNEGLARLAARPGIDRFWVLNPDSAVPPATPAAFATAPAPPGGFALMGGRVLYLDRPDRIQIDGGTLNRATGVTGNVHLGWRHPRTPPPDPGQVDFVTGASMVASRAFYEAAGPMPEDYFLYYEEVEWALRRGRLPLAYCEGAIVYHRAGTAIGSPKMGRPASPFSLYFKHRGRMRFLRRHFPLALPTGLAYSLVKAGQVAARGYRAEARAILQASLGLPPPAVVRARLSPAARAHAFGARG